MLADKSGLLVDTVHTKIAVVDTTQINSTVKQFLKTAQVVAKGADNTKVWLKILGACAGGSTLLLAAILAVLMSGKGGS